MSLATLNTQISSLPELIVQMNGELEKSSEHVFSQAWHPSIERIYLTGCGDSHHAAICTSHFFSQTSGLSCIALPAMELARYQTEGIAKSIPGSTLVIAISASGQVSRTIEALSLAKKAGAITVAATGNIDSPLAKISDYQIPTTIPSMPETDSGLAVPGTRSFMVSLLALYHAAISFSEAARQISSSDAWALREELNSLAEPARATIEANMVKSQLLTERWLDAGHFVYCGAGPNWGTSLFSAAKLLEASGDTAIAYDLEEWAHLEYFSRPKATPTFIISGGGRDQGRALEVATAAKTIGREVVIISPVGSELNESEYADVQMKMIGKVREFFSPILSCIPGLLFAASRAESISEPYFRGFGGGRSSEEGGGISRIRSSRRLDEIPE